MSQRPSRTPVAPVAPVANIALVLALTLCLLPVAAPAEASGKAGSVAGPRIRVTQTESRLLERLERWHTALWKDVMSLWGKAGARIDDNGKS